MSLLVLWLLVPDCGLNISAVSMDVGRASEQLSGVRKLSLFGTWSPPLDFGNSLDSSFAPVSNFLNGLAQKQFNWPTDDGDDFCLFSWPSELHCSLELLAMMMFWFRLQH